MKRPLLLAMLVLAPALAAARPRVAVMKLDNDPGGVVADLVSEVLESDATLVGSKEVNRTVDRLGLPEELSDRDVKKLATELEVDALVRGNVTKKGGNHIAHFKVFVKGKRKGFMVEYSNLKSEKLKNALHDKFLEKIGGKAAADADDEASDEDRPKKGKKGEKAEKAEKSDDMASEDEDRPKKGKKGEKAEKSDEMASEDEDRPKKAKKAADEEDPTSEPAGEDGKNSDNEDRPRKKKRTASLDDDSSDGELRGSVETGRKSKAIDPNRVALRVDVGASATQRTLQYTARAFDQAPKPYKNSPVPGLRVGGELYPFAFSNRYSPLAGLGFAGSYDKTLSLSVQTTEQPGTKFKVVEQRWEVGVRYRVPFGSSATSPMVVLAGDYATRTFLINRGALVDGHKIDVPDVNYKGMDIGLDLRFPISAKAALFAGGRAMFVTGAGPIQLNDSYGQAKITAGMGAAGLDLSFGRFVLRLQGEYAQFGYAFTGTGMETNARDGDPTTKDIGGAADRYLGGSGTLGVLY